MPNLRFEFDLPNKPTHTQKFAEETGGWQLFIEEDKLVIIGDCSYEQAKLALENHNGLVAEPSIEEKLASVGLSVDDLKAALGL